MKYRPDHWEAIDSKDTEGTNRSETFIAFGFSGRFRLRHPHGSDLRHLLNMASSAVFFFE